MKTIMHYDFANDVNAAISIKGIDIDSFCTICSVPKRTLFYSYNNECSKEVLERVYSSIYDMGIILSTVKSELIEENLLNNNFIIYHASKNGIDNLTYDGSRSDCDFGKGFYLTRLLSSAKSFIETTLYSSIYTFSFNILKAEFPRL